MTLVGTNVLVTGASRGLGRALVEAFAREGARVVGVARGEAALEAAMAAIRRETRAEVHAVTADVAEPAAAARILGEAGALIGPIDVLVQNASTLGPVPLRPTVEVTDADFLAVLQANVLGPHRLARALVGGMVARGRGAVVAITSDAAVEPYPGWGVYGASKAALEHLHRVMAAELEGTGVRVAIVDPGEMDTRMHADAVPDADPATLRRPEEVARWIVQDLRRGGSTGVRAVALTGGAA